MKRTLKIMVILAIAFVACGFAYSKYVSNDSNYETVVYHERLHSGDTFNTVIEKYYNASNERDSWDEWQTKTKQRNKRLFFYENGKPRYLQPGDIVCIEVREKIKK